MNIACKTLIATGLVFFAGCSDTSNRPVETADAEEPEPGYEATPVSAPPVTEATDEDDTTATEADGTAAGTMGSSGDARSAMDSITEARCDREATCENVGSDKTYSSRDDCMARIRDDWRDDLNARECPGGADQTELNECLTAIRNEDCGNPFDTLARLVECGSGQICVD